MFEPACLGQDVVYPCLNLDDAVACSIAPPLSNAQSIGSAPLLIQCVLAEANPLSHYLKIRSGHCFLKENSS